MTAAAFPETGKIFAGQYQLLGPSPRRDARTTAIRGDLADIALAGKLFAPHYVIPMERALSVPHALLRKAKGDDGEAGSELLEGERFMVLDYAGGWAWGYCAHDCYLGYLPEEVLGDPAAHPKPTYQHADPVAVAETLLGMPYVWGGRGGVGIDCSGLMQIAFARAGYALPRDSDQQEASAGHLLGAEEAPRHGDLLFFAGHVGVLEDADTLIHASQAAGMVVREPLAEIAARREGGITSRRRVL